MDKISLSPVKQVQKLFSPGLMARIFVLLLFVFSTSFSSFEGLELKRVILSTNNNPMYIQFWPVVAPLWEALGLRPTLALIADEDCPIDTTIGDVYRFAPIPGISEALQAQCIRLMLPALFPDEACLISDIDMLPISRSYFFSGASRCPNNAFLVYRDKAYGKSAQRYPMCYLAAKGSVFSDVFGVSSSDQFPALIEAWSSLGHGWNTDEFLLFQYLIKWERQGGSVIRLHQPVVRRLDRVSWHLKFNPTHIGGYIDCHCPRPYFEYKDSIDEVVNAIYSQWR